jgi:hypothetical protein
LDGGLTDRHDLVEAFLPKKLVSASSGYLAESDMRRTVFLQELEIFCLLQLSQYNRQLHCEVRPDVAEKVVDGRGWLWL